MLVYYFSQWFTGIKIEKRKRFERKREKISQRIMCAGKDGQNEAFHIYSPGRAMTSQTCAEVSSKLACFAVQ